MTPQFPETKFPLELSPWLSDGLIPKKKVFLIWNFDRFLLTWLFYWCPLSRAHHHIPWKLLLRKEHKQRVYGRLGRCNVLWQFTRWEYPRYSVGPSRAHVDLLAAVIEHFYDFCFLYWRNVGELSSRGRAPACPITCIAPSSETTTGGVYKWQGRNRHSLMSYAYEIFLVTRPIIAILGPNWVDVIPVFPRPCGQAGPTKRRSSCSHWHCSARVAQSIEEHHRPAVAQNFT